MACNPYNFLYLTDPIKLGRVLWPDVKFYRKEEEIIYSVWENEETIVPAGHTLGKDYVTGFICLAFFMTRKPCRIVTNSVDHQHLELVLWGEIRRFIQTSKYPLEAERGGPLLINHMHIRQVGTGKFDKGVIEPLSYLIGRTAEKGEGLSGHYIARTGDGIPRTLFVGDEVSGVDPINFEKATEWCNRMLLIGNPYPCNNYFKWAVKGKPGSKDRGGDIPRPVEPGQELGANGYHRKIIQIKAIDSPNVQLALAEKAAGKVPSGTLLIPGVLPWEDYEKRLVTWDEVKQKVGLDAEWYEGAMSLLYPPQWLDRAEEIADWLASNGVKRRAKALGIDPAEGGDKTAWAVVDEYGLIALFSEKTPDTSYIIRRTIALMTEYDIPPDRVVFDRGGGGKQHADQLRYMGYEVRTVGFGESVSPEPAFGFDAVPDRILDREKRYAFRFRRDQLYWDLRELLDPNLDRGATLLSESEVRMGRTPVTGFGLPREYFELRQQLAPIPLEYDREGRFALPPKHHVETVRSGGGKIRSLTELIGHSPDEADSLVLGIHALLHETATVATAGAIL